MIVGLGLGQGPKIGRKFRGCPLWIELGYGRGRVRLGVEFSVGLGLG